MTLWPSATTQSGRLRSASLVHPPHPSSFLRPQQREIAHILCAVNASSTTVAHTLPPVAVDAPAVIERRRKKKDNPVAR